MARFAGRRSQDGRGILDSSRRWTEPVHRSTRILRDIEDWNRGRDPERLHLKYKAMHKDALAFFRGTCHLFCADWPRHSRLDETPPVWVCGDLHVENFGAYRGDDRLVYFDIADFDESALAPCAWDLARLAASAFLAARVHGLDRPSARALCRGFLDAYRATLREGKARWIERSVAQGLVRAVLHRALRESRSTFLSERTERGAGRRKLAIDGKHTLAADARDRERVEGFIRDFAERTRAPDFFRLLDVARRIAGTGSLGLERYTLLVNGTGGAGRLLLDLKLAAPSALAGRVEPRQPDWKTEAERVVAVQQRMQAIAPAFLRAVTIGKRAYVLRELMPTQDKLDLAKWRSARGGFELLARDLGFLVAWSQLRSGGRDGSSTIDELIDFAGKRKWRAAILDYAEDYSHVAWRDWKAFRTAWRDKALQA